MTVKRTTNGRDSEDRIIREQKEQISNLQKKIETLTIQQEISTQKYNHLQTVANFATDWELWIKPNKELNYCSPSCQDLTGFSANEIQQTQDVWPHVIYPSDLASFYNFIDDTLNFSILNQTFEFRILTRTKQIRWCEMNCKAIYNEKGKFMGIRASIRDISRLRAALGHIKQLSETNVHEQNVKNQYKTELENTERELISSLLLVSNKNALLSYIKKKLQSLRNNLSPKDESIVDDIQQKIIGSTIISSEWETFRVHFEKMHPGFLEKLTTQFPQLTQKDLTLASYLRLNLSSKEISGLLNITSASVEIARVRLRKKLNLEKKSRLTTFIRNL